MKYLLLIYDNESSRAVRSEAERSKSFQEYLDYSGRILQSGNYIAAEALQPTSSATTLLTKNGKVVTTDGPFAETREQLGGFYLVEAKDLDQAVTLATGIPGVRTGSIEVRPVLPTPPPK